MRTACFLVTAGALTCSATAFAQTPQPAPYGQSYGQSYGTQPATGAPGLQSGGLTPPQSAPAEPYAMSAPPTPTEQELERADREDAGRGLEFVWLNAEVGVEHLGLQTFKANDLVTANTVDTTQTGPMFGAGAGVRLVFLTLGARFRMGTFSAWQLWTLNGELGVRIPIGRLEPYFTLGGGYASVGHFDSSNVGTNLNDANVSIRGFDVRAGVGLDLYLSSLFSIGANLTGEMLALTRPGVSLSKLAASGSTTTQQAEAKVYSADGSSIGAAVTLSAVAGLHF